MRVSDCWQAAYRLIGEGKTEEAIALCEQGICAHSMDCQRYLGWRYYESDEFEKAESWFSKAAEQEDAEAMFGIGSLHFVKRDFLSAERYYELAADRGYSRAYHWIGYMYEHGLGVSRDTGLAEKYYAEGTRKGYLISERALIRLAFQHGRLSRKVFLVPRYITMLVRAAIIAYRDINDERIVDVPNVFERDKQLPGSGY